MGEIHLQFVATDEVNRQLTKAVLKGIKWSLTKDFLVWVIVLALFALLFIYEIWPGPNQKMNLVGLGSGLAVAAVIISLRTLAHRDDRTKAARAQSPPNPPVAWIISPQRLETESNGIRQSLLWPHLAEIRENSFAFILYTKTGIAHCLPKSAFASVDEIALLRTMARENNIPTTQQAG